MGPRGTGAQNSCLTAFFFLNNVENKKMQIAAWDSRLGSLCGCSSLNSSLSHAPPRDLRADQRFLLTGCYCGERETVSSLLLSMLPFPPIIVELRAGREAASS